jgi:hypothetical protein
MLKKDSKIFILGKTIIMGKAESREKENQGRKRESLSLIFLIFPLFKPISFTHFMVSCI